MLSWMWKLVHLLLDFINTPLKKIKKKSHKSLPYSGLRFHNSVEQPQRIHFLPLPSQKINWHSTAELMAKQKCRI